MAIKPVFQKTDQGKTSQQYLDELDALLKKNTGRFTNIGTETSSQSPFSVGNIVPGVKMADASGLGTVGNLPTKEANIPLEQQNGYQEPVMGRSDIVGFLNDFQTQVAISEMTPQAVSTTDEGGTVYSNGFITYEDGSYRTGDAKAYAVASMPDGGYIYSDGSTRKVAKPIASVPGGYIMLDDGNIVNDKGVLFTDSEFKGVQALSQGLFGQQQTVTQQYGNINPIEPTPGNVNYGTDFRTRDLASKDIYFPVGAEVVQVLRDDGTQYGTVSGHQGYGNSVLLRLPSGEMLRLSHLSRIGELQVGQTLDPQSYVGTTGATGNVTGEHLDVEYYNQEGKIDNPMNFSGFKTPEIYVTKPATQPEEKLYSPIQNTPEQPVQNQQLAPQAPAPAPSPIVSAAKTIEQINPTGQFGLGITESMQGNPEGARLEQANTIESVGTALKAPELQTGELSAQQNTNPFRQLAGNLVDITARKIGIPTDFGISEALAGGRTTSTDRSLIPEAVASEGQIASYPPQAKDYASVLGKNIDDATKYAQNEVKLFADRATSKAGEGVQALKNVAAGIQGGVDNLFDRKKPQDVSGQRMVGEDTPGSNALPIESTAPGGVINDIRDPFFKQGGEEIYKDYLNPGQIGQGALSLGLFNDRFYQDPNNIANVFGSTNLVGQATDKYKNYQRSLYQGKDEYGNDLYDQNEVNNFLSQITPFTTPNPTFAPEVRKQLPSFATQISGSSATPRMASVSISAPRPSIQQISRPSSSPQVNYSSPSNSSPQRSPIASYPSTSPASVSKPAPYSPVRSPIASYPSKPAINYSPVKQSTPAPKNYSPVRQSTPAPQSKPNTNIFSRAVSAVKSIFKR